MKAMLKLPVDFRYSQQSAEIQSHLKNLQFPQGRKWRFCWYGVIRMREIDT